MKVPAPVIVLHSRALRKGRVSQPGRIYHLRTSTYCRKPIFSDLFIGRIVVNSMRFLHERGDVKSLAFVAMPDHVHWLVELRKQASLDALMRSFKSHTARKINARIGATGNSVWQPGYFDRVLRGEEDIQDAARYIVGNPVRAGLCQHVNDYSLWDAIWMRGW
jgi:REP element-mobilizing transposase RayT